MRQAHHLVQRAGPPGDVGGARDRQEPGSRSGVQGSGNIIGAKRAVPAALDVAAPGGPGPGQQVGVVLDNGGHDDVVRRELQTIGEVVYRFGRVATDDGHVVAALAAGEAQDGVPGSFVGVGRPLGFVPRAPVHARVPRQELFNSGQHRWEGRRRGGCVARKVRALLTVDARHQGTVADQWRQRRQPGRCHKGVPIVTLEISGLPLAAHSAQARAMNRSSRSCLLGTRPRRPPL